MGSIRKEILTKAGTDAVWSVILDVGALHTRLVPGFVTDTRLEPGARIVTFGNGMVLREPIVAVDDKARFAQGVDTLARVFGTPLSRSRVPPASV
jgi:hypothetical protein